MKAILVLFWAAVHACTALAQSPGVPPATWSEASSGLPVARTGVVALTIDPATPSTLYVCSTAGKLFKSTDGGASWRTLSSVVGVSSLVLDRHTPSTLYVGTGHGLLKSTNGGETWIDASSGLPPSRIREVIDPVTSSTLYAVNYSRIFKTTDGGTSWNETNAGLGSLDWIRPPVIDAVTPSTLYVSTSRGIFRSTDGGQTWGALPGGTSPNGLFITLVVIDAANPSTLYAGYSVNGSTGMAKSMDAGQSWRAVLRLPQSYVSSIAADPSSPSVVYAAYGSTTSQTGGILQSTDAGENWEVVSSTAGITSLAIDPANPSTIYAGYGDGRLPPSGGGGGVLKSTDRGASWSAADAGLTSIHLQALAMDPVNPSKLYAAIGDSVFKTDDGGAEWGQLVAFHLPAASFANYTTLAAVLSLAIDFRDPNTIYAWTGRPDACTVNDNLLFKSTDGGANWRDHAGPSGICIFQGLITMDPTDPDTLYLAEYDDFDGDYWLAKTVDAGATWSYGIWDSHDSGPISLAIDPGQPNTVYAGTNKGLIKSADGGMQWTAIGLEDRAVSVLTIDSAGSVYAATEDCFAPTEGCEPQGFRGLFKSTDSGTTWSTINGGLERLFDTRSRISALVVKPNNPQILFAASPGNGVFRSLDGGASWRPFNAGLADLDVRVLSISPGESNVLYAGTSGGIFKLTDDVREGSIINRRPR